MFPKEFILFSILDSKMSRNMCKLRLKVRNGQTYTLEVQILSISKPFFQIQILLFILGFQKLIASIRP